MNENVCGPASPERVIERIREYRQRKISTQEIPLVSNPSWYFGVTYPENQNIYYLYLINTKDELVVLDIKTSRIANLYSCIEENADLIKTKISEHRKKQLEREVLKK